MEPIYNHLQPFTIHLQSIHNQLYKQYTTIYNPQQLNTTIHNQFMMNPHDLNTLQAEEPKREEKCYQ